MGKSRPENKCYREVLRFAPAAPQPLVQRHEASGSNQQPSHIPRARTQPWNTLDPDHKKLPNPLRHLPVGLCGGLGSRGRACTVPAPACDCGRAGRRQRWDLTWPLLTHRDSSGSSALSSSHRWSRSRHGGRNSFLRPRALVKAAEGQSHWLGGEEPGGLRHHRASAILTARTLCSRPLLLQGSPRLGWGPGPACCGSQRCGDLSRRGKTMGSRKAEQGHQDGSWEAQARWPPAQSISSLREGGTARKARAWSKMGGFHTTPSSLPAGASSCFLDHHMVPKAGALSPCPRAEACTCAHHHTCLPQPERAC